ncbi:MAG: HD domain-containing phosphohydrolase, partial [Planctomycetota bacterium]|nr:HD domain-containing phosphohydrolase [Planctomycetota bacterium]
MTLSSAISFTDQVDTVLRRQGAVRLLLDVRRPDYDLETDDWLRSLLLSSPIVRKAVGEACARVERGGDLESHEVCPGLWLVSFGLPATGTDARICCIVIPTQDLERSEFLDLLCQSARLDRTLVASMLGEFDLLGSTEIPRYCSFMHLAGLSECEISRRSAMLSSLGKQLGDSYEEIHLYHPLIGNTSVSTTPDEFLDAVVKELQRVLPFSWVGVRLCRDLQRIPGVLDGFMIAGTAPETPSRIATAGDRLIESLEGRSPVVLDAGLADSSRPSRSTVVACPIVGDSGIVGVLLAGTRPGDSRTVSSIETKLLGAAAEHVSVFLRNARLYANLDSMFLGTVQGMVSAIDAKDQYTRGHSQRVAWLARALARECGLPESMASRVYLAGLVHDVGKIGVPEHVLQ